MNHKITLEIEANEYSDALRALKDCIDSIECFDDIIKTTGLILNETECGYRYKMSWELASVEIVDVCTECGHEIKNNDFHDCEIFVE